MENSLRYSRSIDAFAKKVVAAYTMASENRSFKEKMSDQRVIISTLNMA